LLIKNICEVLYVSEALQQVILWYEITNTIEFSRREKFYDKFPFRRFDFNFYAFGLE